MTVQGLDRLQRKLMQTIPARAIARTRAAMETGAAELVALMKSLAPKDKGALAASINWTWGEAPAGSLVLASVGSNTYAAMRITIFAGDESTIVTNKRGIRFQNAILQEFGTKNMPANPYFYVSYRALRRRIRSRITREMKKGVIEGAS